MSDRKPCIHCGRAIDAWAKICPFCNWDQTVPVPAAEPATTDTSAYYQPPEEHRLRKWLLMGGGGVAMVILAFVVGFAILGHKTSKAKEPKATLDMDQPAVAVQERPKANVDLVPTNESTPPVEAPITSAPAANTTDTTAANYQRTDATAVSSDEYAQLAARAKAEREKKRMEALVDPRALTGAAYDQGEPPPRRAPVPPPMTSGSSAPVEQQRISIRTRPVPEYQPLPHISQSATARLELVVGADGRVKEVTVREGIPGETSRIIAAVQSWRFKPATENGNPVEAPFTVDISFHGNE